MIIMTDNDDKFDSLKYDCKTEEISASHFALQIALQTMKERCQLLQQRLSAVEEENLRLRIESQNNNASSERVPASELTLLAEKITQLTRQKSQLVDRITMVAKENNQLWSRLSRLTEANQSLGSHLTKISDTLNKHPIGDIISNDQVDQGSTLPDGNSDKKEESLEEISLKIIDTIRQEKKVLERQCEEMVKLQTGAVSVEECGFVLTADEELANGVVEGDEENSEDVMYDIRKLREKMRDDYKLLKCQQAGLQAAVVSISSILSDKKCLSCKEKINKKEDRNANKTTEPHCTISTGALKSPLDEIQKQLKDVTEPPSSTDSDSAGSSREQDELNNKIENNNYDACKNFDDRICPLCCRFYSQKVPFEEFNEHVLSHFNNENEEQDSIVANFEFVT